MVEYVDPKFSGASEMTSLIVAQPRRNAIFNRAL